MSVPRSCKECRRLGKGSILCEIAKFHYGERMKDADLPCKNSNSISTRLEGKQYVIKFE